MFWQGTRVGRSSRGCRHLNLALLLKALYPVPRSPDAGVRAEHWRGKQRLDDATYQCCCLSPVLAFQPHHCPERGKLEQS